MKKNLLYLFLAASLCLSLFSCDKEDENYLTYKVSVALVYPADSEFDVKSDVPVKLQNTANGNVYDSKTNPDGIADFEVPAGVYDVTVTDTRSNGGVNTIFNGNRSSLTVSKSWDGSETVEISLTSSFGGRLLIKELYAGGCPTDDGSSAYTRDQYIILTNNSGAPIEIGDVCLGVVNPYNATGTNKDYIDGKLYYEAEGWIPGGSGFWAFPAGVNPVLEPGQDIVIALNNAINNTTVYSNSINFDDPSYYATYDPEIYTNTSSYTLPTVIPSSHYLKAYMISAGNAWVLSQLSPAVFIFSTEGMTVGEFVKDADSSTNESLNRKKVPVEWVTDGLEVFRSDADGNNKRLTSTIDAGYVNFTAKMGFTLYRNVDKQATEALEENAGKLVYGYSLGTQDLANGTTDPSGIDAEASIKNGARIIYQDTNNSSNDFHQRSRASLRN